MAARGKDDSSTTTNSASGETRLALVTGSTSGIGLAIAKALAAKGYDIVINGFGSPEDIQRARDECLAKGAGRVEYHGADLSDPPQIEKMFEYVKEQFSGRGPDVLVNNAGVQHVAPITECPTEKWDLVIAVNLSASFHTCRLAIGGMKERGWGRIVNIASAHGKVASPNKAPYAASKHGLVGLTKGVALETAGTGITCNAICPGWVLTPLTIPQVEAISVKKGVSFEEAKKILLSNQPSLQFVLPEEIGAMVVYLCSEEARQITGSDFSIDGGWTAK